MRDFKDITVIPTTFFVAVDGEGYHCAPFAARDLQGATRVLPAGRLMAIHWFGDHAHGQAEGFGAIEGFSDRGQVEPYVGPWLAARATAKRDRVDALMRKCQQELEQATATRQAISTIDDQLADLDKELSAASNARRPQVQGQIDVLGGHRATLVSQVSAAGARATTPDHVSDAEALAREAEKERDQWRETPAQSHRQKTPTAASAAPPG